MTETNQQRNLGQTLAFYEALAPEYASQFDDWYAEAMRQGRVIGSVIKSEFGGAASRVLDCACGIGTQALGLAQLGFEVVGSDLSPASLDQARAAARLSGSNVQFFLANYCSLESVAGNYDVVCCCDNALPHLLEDTDVVTALGSMRAKVGRDGGVLVTIRDYDYALDHGVSGQVPRIVATPDGPVIVFQIWEWQTPTIYRLRHFMMRAHDANWVAEEYVATYRAIRRAELSRLMADASFVDIRWHMPAATGYHQPILTAHVDR